MIQGLYAAATGMMALEERQAVIANNIANASTPGFKSQNALFEGFHQILLDKLRNPSRLNHFPGPGGGVKVTVTYTDMRNGTVNHTGDPLNIAIEGPGLIAVNTPQGERFTRNGKLAVSPDGYLTTVDGYEVQGTRGRSIAIEPGTLEIDRDGTVNIDGASVGQIRLVEFEDPRLLTREGSNLFSASPEAALRGAAGTDTRIVGRSLELSNVKIPRQLGNLTIGLRAYVANQRVIAATDETMRRVIEQVGSPL